MLKNFQKAGKILAVVMGVLMIAVLALASCGVNQSDFDDLSAKVDSIEAQANAAMTQAQIEAKLNAMLGDYASADDVAELTKKIAEFVTAGDLNAYAKNSVVTSIQNQLNTVLASGNTNTSDIAAIKAQLNTVLAQLEGIGDVSGNPELTLAKKNALTELEAAQDVVKANKYPKEADASIRETVLGYNTIDVICAVSEDELAQILAAAKSYEGYTSLADAIKNVNALIDEIGSESAVAVSATIKMEGDKATVAVTGADKVATDMYVDVTVGTAKKVTFGSDYQQWTMASGKTALSAIKDAKVFTRSTSIPADVATNAAWGGFDYKNTSAAGVHILYNGEWFEYIDEITVPVLDANGNQYMEKVVTASSADAVAAAQTAVAALSTTYDIKTGDLDPVKSDDLSDAVNKIALAKVNAESAIYTAKSAIDTLLSAINAKAHRLDGEDIAELMGITATVESYTNAAALKDTTYTIKVNFNDYEGITNPSNGYEKYVAAVKALADVIDLDRVSNYEDFVEYQTAIIENLGDAIAYAVEEALENEVDGIITDAGEFLADLKVVGSSSEYSVRYKLVKNVVADYMVGVEAALANGVDFSTFVTVAADVEAVADEALAAMKDVAYFEGFFDDLVDIVIENLTYVKDEDFISYQNVINKIFEQIINAFLVAQYTSSEDYDDQDVMVVDKKGQYDIGAKNDLEDVYDFVIFFPFEKKFDFDTAIAGMDEGQVAYYTAVIALYDEITAYIDATADAVEAYEVTGTYEDAFWAIYNIAGDNSRNSDNSKIAKLFDILTAIPADIVEQFDLLARGKAGDATVGGLLDDFATAVGITDFAEDFNDSDSVAKKIELVADLFATAEKFIGSQEALETIVNKFFSYKGVTIVIPQTNLVLGDVDTTEFEGKKLVFEGSEGEGETANTPAKPAGLYGLFAGAGKYAVDNTMDKGANLPVSVVGLSWIFASEDMADAIYDLIETGINEVEVALPSTLTIPVTGTDFTYTVTLNTDKAGIPYSKESKTPEKGIDFNAFDMSKVTLNKKDQVADIMDYGEANLMPAFFAVADELTAEGANALSVLTGFGKTFIAAKDYADGLVFASVLDDYKIELLDALGDFIDDYKVGNRATDNEILLANKIAEKINTLIAIAEALSVDNDDPTASYTAAVSTILGYGANFKFNQGTAAQDNAFSDLVKYEQGWRNVTIEQDKLDEYISDKIDKLEKDRDVDLKNVDKDSNLSDEEKNLLTILYTTAYQDVMDAISAYELVNTATVTSATSPKFMSYEAAVAAVDAAIEAQEAKIAKIGTDYTGKVIDIKTAYIAAIDKMDAYFGGSNVTKYKTAWGEALYKKYVESEQATILKELNALAAPYATKATTDRDYKGSNTWAGTVASMHSFSKWVATIESFDKLISDTVQADLNNRFADINVEYTAYKAYLDSLTNWAKDKGSNSVVNGYIDAQIAKFTFNYTTDGKNTYTMKAAFNANSNEKTFVEGSNAYIATFTAANKVPETLTADSFTSSLADLTSAVKWTATTYSVATFKDGKFEKWGDTTKKAWFDEYEGIILAISAYVDGEPTVVTPETPDEPETPVYTAEKNIALNGDSYNATVTYSEDGKKMTLTLSDETEVKYLLTPEKYGPKAGNWVGFKVDGPANAKVVRPDDGETNDGKVVTPRVLGDVKDGTNADGTVFANFYWNFGKDGKWKDVKEVTYKIYWDGVVDETPDLEIVLNLGNANLEAAPASEEPENP